MNSCPMTSMEIIKMINNYPMMKCIVYTLIQNPMMMNPLTNIINNFIYNPETLTQIKNYMNQDLNMMNFSFQNINMINAINNSSSPMNQMTTTIKKIEPITIFFRKNDRDVNERDITVQCLPNEKVSDAINKYRQECGDFDQTKKFIYNAKPLHPSLTLKEANLCERSSVFVVVTQGVKGG